MHSPMLSAARAAGRPRPWHLVPVLFVITLVAALLGAGAPAAHADDFEPGYPRMGEADEGVSGLRVLSSGSTVGTTLFPLYTHAGSAGPDTLAYCVELTVPARYGISLNAGDWDSFPGDNRFKESQSVREHVAWIIYTSYPQRPLAAVIADSGITGLTEREAIAGTQASIWTYTDDLTYTGVLAEPASHARVQALVDYLTGPANIGRPETVGTPGVAVDVSAVTGRAGDLVGPITITSSAATVALEVTGDHPLVLDDGTPVDLQAAPTGTGLFLQVPGGAPAGEMTISATAVGVERTGMLVSSTEPRAQTLMIARSDQARAQASATVSWEAVPEVSTSAADGEDGDGYLPEDGAATVVDTVSYTGLVPGTEYTLEAELMDGESGEPTGITATSVFTPESPDGTVEVSLDLGPDEGIGSVLVVFERLYAGGELVAEHTDIDDEAQTLYRPAIETDAYDRSDGDQVLSAGGGTLRDDVAYSGLRAGQAYVVRGELMDQETGEATGITAEADLVPESPSGVAQMDFAISDEHAGRALVVYERLYLPGGEEPLATHTDLSSERQSVRVDVPPSPTTPPPPTAPPSTPPPALPATPPSLPSTGADLGSAALLCLIGLGTLAIGAGLVARARAGRG